MFIFLEIIAGFAFLIINMFLVIIVGVHIGALGNYLFGEDHRYTATDGWLTVGVLCFIPIFILEVYLLSLTRL